MTLYKGPGRLSVLTFAACIVLSACAVPAVPSPKQPAEGTSRGMASGSASQASEGEIAQVRPSRNAVFFDTLEVPLTKIAGNVQVPAGFTEQVQASLIRAMTEERLFTHVVPYADYRPGGGGVLTVHGTVLTWNEDPAGVTLTMHIALVAKGIGDRFGESTAEGRINRISAREDGNSDAPQEYDIASLVEGLVTFISRFMEPT